MFHGRWRRWLLWFAICLVAAGLGCALWLVWMVRMSGHAPESPLSPLVAPPRVAVGVRMQDVRFSSTALGREMPYRVFLPQHVAGGVRLPVVYLLHGRGPDFRDWSVNSDLSRYAAAGESGVTKDGLILVMPEGGDSFYVNAAGKPRDRYEDYLVRDLAADVEQRFPARSDRAGKAIMGISMGGYGAIAQGLRHPESYAYVGGLSAAVDVTERRFRPNRWGQWWLFQQIFGPMDSATRADRDPFELVKRVDPKTAPYFYLTVGKDEPLLEPDRRFAGAMAAHGFASEFHEMPGGHDWGEWQSQLPGCFARLQQVLTAQGRSIDHKMS